jgi:hypothetical protein
MNKRFKRSGFDERIIGYAKNLIDMVSKLFEVNIIAVGENTDAITIRWNHKYNGAESAIEPRVIDNFF